MQHYSVFAIQKSKKKRKTGCYAEFSRFSSFSENNVQTECSFFVQFAIGQSCPRPPARNRMRARPRVHIYGRDPHMVSRPSFYFSVVKRCSDPGHPGQRHFSIVKR